eukprot:COSAG02_NODE_10049_length_2038_cov_2.604951_2_plen_191_part_00
MLPFALAVTFLSTATLADWCQPPGSSGVANAGTYCRYDPAYLADGGDGWGVQTCVCQTSSSANRAVDCSNSMSSTSVGKCGPITGGGMNGASCGTGGCWYDGPGTRATGDDDGTNLGFYDPQPGRCRLDTEECKAQVESGGEPIQGDWWMYVLFFVIIIPLAAVAKCMQMKKVLVEKEAMDSANPAGADD